MTEYLADIKEMENLCTKKGDAWNGINPEYAVRMKLQNRFQSGLDIARHTAAVMRKDMADSAAEMLEECGFKDVQKYDNRYALGLGIHEMGTARMGKDPKNSVLNRWNQIHTCKNVFVTDGSCMTSSSCVNPSITYMALTARAANFAINELKKGNL